MEFNIVVKCRLITQEDGDCELVPEVICECGDSNPEWVQNVAQLLSKIMSATMPELIGRFARAVNSAAEELQKHEQNVAEAKSSSTIH